MLDSSKKSKTRRRMSGNFCPYCNHCNMIKEFEEKAEKKRLEREERVKVEKERAIMEEKKRVERGVIYGDDYNRYKVEDIQKITDYNFLMSMSMNRYGPAQPPTQEDYDEMCYVLKAVSKRMREIKSEVESKSFDELINELE